MDLVVHRFIYGSNPGLESTFELLTADLNTIIIYELVPTRSTAGHLRAMNSQEYVKVFDVEHIYLMT